MNPLISVVMCTFNSEQYISKAIESILEQSYDNFEFIIWNDGSTDNTESVIKSYSDKRIRYFFHENTGLGMALKLACEYCNGEYIARMDSDDISLSDRFKIQVNYLEKHRECVLVSSAVYIISENGKNIGRTFPCSDSEVLKQALLKPANMIAHPMVMMRHDAYKKAGGYLPIKKSQDLLFWSRLAKTGSFYNISTPLGKYRELDSSLDHTINPYSSVLKMLLRKMVLDEEVLYSDIEMYNYLWDYSRKFICDVDTGLRCDNSKSLEEQMFNVFRILWSDASVASIIVNLKNLIYRIKMKW